MTGTTGKMFVRISMCRGRLSGYQIILVIYWLFYSLGCIFDLLFLVKISACLLFHLHIIHSSFAAANKIGAKGLGGRSWPDLDMLPFGRLTDAGNDPYHNILVKFVNPCPVASNGCYP